jgi:DNA-binding CsgD family transcriptional regulator
MLDVGNMGNFEMSTIALERVLETFLKTGSETSMSSRPTEDFLHKICEIYQLQHASYIAVDKRSLMTRQPKISVTYPHEWQVEYRRSFSEMHDPVLKFGLNAVLPFDWQDSQVTSIDSENILDRAKEFGLGEHGVTVPIRSQFGPKALFSVTGNMSKPEWLRFNKEFCRDFVAIGHFIHKHLHHGTQTKQTNLSKREIEVLRLCAFGYSINVVADELEITVSTVNYYLNQARFKLNALNTTHAVFKASNLGLIYES